MTKDIPVLDSYRVNLDTYLVAPYKEGEKIYSYIFDKNGEYIVKRKPFYIIRKSCDLFGYNYNAAIRFSKNFFGKDKHKVPINLPHLEAPNIMIPIYSPSSPNNIWIGLHGISIISDPKLPTEITLPDGKEHPLPVSFTSFQTQYLRAIELYKHVFNLKQEIQPENKPKPKPLKPINPIYPLNQDLDLDQDD